MKPDRNIQLQIESLLRLNGFKDYLIPVIVAQFAHETANFTSKVFIENNNLSGMKLPEKRLTTAIGEKNSHALYNSLRDCVKDFRYYFDYFKIDQVPYTIEGYVKMLKIKGYFEDSTENYTKGVERFYKLYYEL